MKHIFTKILKFSQIDAEQYFADTQTGTIYQKINEQSCHAVRTDFVTQFDCNRLVYDLPGYNQEER